MVCANSLNAVIAYVGILKTGACIILMNPYSSAESIKEIIQFSESNSIVFNKEFEEKIISIPNITSINIDTINLENKSQDLTLPLISDSDNALISFTSGSSGNPKGVILTHKNIISDCSAISKWIGFTKEDRFLGVQNLFYIDHIVWMNVPLIEGGSLD